jgi:hypothetical protein
MVVFSRGEMEISVRNRKWDEGRFLKERRDVLSRWPTGKEVDFEEAVAYHRGLPDSKNFTKVMQGLHRDGRTVIFPRGGTGAATATPSPPRTTPTPVGKRTPGAPSPCLPTRSSRASAASSGTRPGPGRPGSLPSPPAKRTRRSWTGWSASGQRNAPRGK